jgi:hypothetical protein
MGAVPSAYHTNDHVARGLARLPAHGPKVETVVQVDVAATGVPIQPVILDPGEGQCMGAVGEPRKRLHCLMCFGYGGD